MTANPPDELTLETWYQARRDEIQQQWDGPNLGIQAEVLAWTPHYDEPFSMVYDMDKRVQKPSTERMSQMLELIQDEESIVTKVMWLP